MDLSAATAVDADLSASLSPTLLGVQAQLSRVAEASASLRSVAELPSVSVLSAGAALAEDVQALDQFRATAYTATAKLQSVLSIGVDLVGSATLSVDGLLDTLHTSVVGLQTGVGGAIAAIASLPSASLPVSGSLPALQKSLSSLQADLGKSATSLQEVVSQRSTAGNANSSGSPATQNAASAWTANDLPILEGTISLPRTGAWHCTLDLSADEAPSVGSKLTIKDGQTSFVSTVLRSGVVGGRASLRAVGGAGGLRKTVPANSWTDVPLRIPLRDTLAAVGETLSTTVDDSLLTARLAHWTRDGGSAGTAITTLLAAQGAVWRVLADGTVWAGVESWPVQSVSGGEVLKPDPEAATFTLASDTLELEPGRTFLGRKVSRVEHRLEPNSVRTFYWAEDEATPATALDRVKESLARFIRWVMRDVTYHKLYPAKVQLQHDDGTLDLYPDDESIRGRGLTAVKIRHGLPGCVVRVSAGAKVLLGFEGGDPYRPYAALWEPDSLESISFDNGTQALARVGDLVMSGGAGTPIIITVGATPVPVLTPSGPGTIAPGTLIIGLVSFSENPLAIGPFAEPLYGAIAGPGAPKLLG